MTRLFVALTVPDAARDAAQQSIAPIRDSELRWVPKERWHVTVEFIGEADPAVTARQWSQRIDGIAPFRLRLAGAGAFPKVRKGTVLWVGVECNPDEWHRLAADDQQPHMTVARSRRPTDLTDVVATLADHAGPAWTATEVVLFDSQSGRDGGGPVYSVIDSFPLSDPTIS
jgi:2'-5' RNA ligase